MNKENQGKKIITSIGINILVLVILFIFFSPSVKNDEYEMSKYLVGAVDGIQGLSLWMNPIFDYIVRFFMELFKTSAAFFVLEYVLVFLSFVCITWVFFQWIDDKKILFSFVIFLLLLGYEFYIRLTFTKTSGALAAAGFLLALYNIENAKKTIHFIIPLVLLFISQIIRINVFLVTTVVFFSTFLIYIICNARAEKSQLYIGIVKFVLFVSCVFVMEKGLSLCKTYVYANSEWQSALDANSYRSNLYDYGWPEYKNHTEEYEELGVSYNDYVVWHDYHILSDNNVLTKELLQNMHEIGDSSGDTRTVFDAIKKLLNYVLFEPTFYSFFGMMLVGIFYTNNGKRFIIFEAITFFGIIIDYVYLYCRGRTMHHVDCCIFLAAFAVSIYCMHITECEAKRKCNRRALILTMLITVIFVATFYNNVGQVLVGQSSYCRALWNDVEGQKNDRQALELVSEDKQHLYAYIYQDIIPFNTFTFEKDFLHNMYRTEYTLGNPVYNRQLDNYDIEGTDAFWGSMINSETIYFRFTDESLYKLESILEYLREHYSKTTEAHLVKHIGNAYVYCFRDKELKLENLQYENVPDDICYSVQAEEKASGETLLKGYVYLKGNDSYSERVYVQTVNKTSGDIENYICTTTENDSMSTQDKYMGKYGAFETVVPIDLNMYLADYEIYLILETEGKYYRIVVDNTTNDGEMDQK